MLWLVRQSCYRMCAVKRLDRHRGGCRNSKTKPRVHQAELNASINTECDIDMDFALRMMSFGLSIASMVPIAIGQSFRDAGSGC